MRFPDTARMVIAEFSPVMVSPLAAARYSQWGYASRGAGSLMPGILSDRFLISGLVTYSCPSDYSMSPPAICCAVRDRNADALVVPRTAGCPRRRPYACG